MRNSYVVYSLKHSMRALLTFTFALLISAILSSRAESSASALRGAMVKLSDYGTDEAAYLTLPTAAPLGGVILLHDGWGLTEELKQTADTLTEADFVVLAVDLFNGQRATKIAETQLFEKYLQRDSAVKTIRAGVKFLRESPRFRTPKVALYGYGLGGNIALYASSQLKDIDAVVLYYAIPELEERLWKQVKVPLLGCYGKLDLAVTPAAVEAFKQRLIASEKQHRFHWFEAGHGFANSRALAYQAPMKVQAEGISTAFLRDVFTAPPPPNIIEKIFK
jgi:carboxymethylenebutenolidase